MRKINYAIAINKIMCNRYAAKFMKYVMQLHRWQGCIGCRITRINGKIPLVSGLDRLSVLKQNLEAIVLQKKSDLKINYSIVACLIHAGKIENKSTTFERALACAYCSLFSSKEKRSFVRFVLLKYDQ